MFRMRPPGSSPHGSAQQASNKSNSELEPNAGTGRTFLAADRTGRGSAAVAILERYYSRMRQNHEWPRWLLWFQLCAAACKRRLLRDVQSKMVRI
jgi:hypothetical protein